MIVTTSCCILLLLQNITFEEKKNKFFQVKISLKQLATTVYS